MGGFLMSKLNKMVFFGLTDIGIFLVITKVMNLIFAMGYCVQLNIDDWAAGFAQLKGRDIKGLIPHLLHSS